MIHQINATTTCTGFRSEGTKSMSRPPGTVEVTLVGVDLLKLIQSIGPANILAHIGKESVQKHYGISDAEVDALKAKIQKLQTPSISRTVTGIGDLTCEQRIKLRSRICGGCGAMKQSDGICWSCYESPMD